MSGWFKRFALSLFSDTQAKESVKFGFGNILLTSLLAVVFIFFGIYAGRTAPFSSYYNGADGFREFLYNALSDDILITPSDGNAEIVCGGKNADIDTLANEEDKRAYSVNGYHLFVNSANVLESYDDFYAYCVTDGGDEISYEDYLSLSQADRKKYTFAMRYTGKVKEVTAEDAVAYLSYLKGLNDEKINSQLDSLDKADEKIYRGSVYALYLQNYYPKLQEFTGEAVPTLRTYYYLQTVKTDGKYVCLFGDMMVVSFKTGTGGTFSYGGTYRADNPLVGGTPSEIDEFIKGTFYDGASMLLVVELMNGISVLAFTELIIVGIMLLSFAVCRLRKRGIGLKFADSARLVASYAHIAAFASALITLCLSFAFSGTAVLVTAYVSFAVIMAVRTLVLLLREKETAAEEEIED